MANWEDVTPGESAGEGDETPIFTGLYLEYREAAFRRIAADLEALKEKREQEGEQHGK